MDEYLGVRDAAAVAEDRAVAVSRRIVVVLVVTLLLRGLAWLFSYFIVGPVFGATSYAVLEELFDSGVPLMVEGVLTAAAVTFTILVAIGVRRDPQLWLGRARAFGRVLAAQTIHYVASIVVVLLVLGGWSDLAGLAWPVAIVTVLNIPVFVLALSIARRAASPSPSGA